MARVSRGSIWHRWDFHVHSPHSAQQKFGAPSKDETWDKYVSALLAAIKKHDISALVFQDYFSIDAYYDLCDFGYYDPKTQLLRRDGSEAKVFLLPGMELRLNQGAKSAINYHLVIDPTLDKTYLYGQLLGKIDVSSHKGFTILPNRLNALCLSIAKDIPEADALELLKTASADDIQHARKTCLLENTQVNADQLHAVLDSINKNQGTLKILTMAAARGHGSIAELGWKGAAGVIRKALTKDVHLLLTSSDKDRDYFTGEGSDPTKEIIKKFGSLKPCVWGSDSHEYNTLLHPSNGNTERYTFIKSDLTFEGIKQILFEPRDRVFIGPTTPRQKSAYTIIDRISLIDKSTGAEIRTAELNSDLVCIIGGKSTGKSILAASIARAANQPLADHRLQDSFKENIKSFWDKYCLRLTWADNAVSSYCNLPNVIERPVTYIPQAYVSAIAEDTESLSRFLSEILEGGELFKSVRDKFRASDETTNSNVSKRASELLRRIESVADHKRDLKEVGERKAIEEEVSRLRKLREAIQKKSGFTDEEERAYNELSEYDSDLRNWIEGIDAHLSDLAIYHERLDSFFTEQETQAKSILSEFSDLSGQYTIDNSNSLAARILLIVQKATASTNRAVAAEIEKDVKHYKQQKKALTGNKRDVERKLRPLKKKAELAQQLNEVSDKIKKEQRKIDSITKIEKKIDSAIHEIGGSIAALLIAIDIRRRGRRAYLDDLLEQLGARDDDLKVIRREEVDTVSYVAKLEAAINLRYKYLYEFPGFDSVERKLNVVTYDNYRDVLEKILRKVSKDAVRESVPLRQGASLQDLLTALASDPFRDRLNIVYRGDDIQEMSPGKRGLVLVSFLMKHSNSEYPIILDQPEDNLDNRTVHGQLVESIRQAKRTRQVVVVTHNANIAVNADAEQVFVCEQNAGAKKLEPNQFEWRAGALEESFRNITSTLHPLDNSGIREHVCDVLEGGMEAFRKRQEKYSVGS